MTADQQQGLVYEFTVDLNTGLFTQMSGSPFKADIGNPTFVCTRFCGSTLIADPLGHSLYFQYNYGSSSVDGVDSLSVNAQDGTLSNNANILEPVSQPSIDPQGRFIYWNGSNGQTNVIGALDISSTGQLSTAPGEPYVYPGQFSYGAPAVSGNYVFSIEYLDPSGGMGSLFEWSIDPGTGTLTRTNNSLPLRLGGNPIATPNGKFVYVQQAYQAGNVYNWEIVPIQVGANGSLTPLTQNAQQTPSTGDSYIWMSPNGNFLYVAIFGQIWDYQINQTTGALTLVQKYTDINTNLLAIDPAVKYVFTSPEGQNQVATTTLTAYSVNPTTGALTPVANSTVDAKVTPIGLAVMAPK